MEQMRRNKDLLIDLFIDFVELRELAGISLDFALLHEQSAVSVSSIDSRSFSREDFPD